MCEFGKPFISGIPVKRNLPGGLLVVGIPPLPRRPRLLRGWYLHSVATSFLACVLATYRYLWFRRGLKSNPAISARILPNTAHIPYFCSCVPLSAGLPRFQGDFVFRVRQRRDDGGALPEAGLRVRTADQVAQPYHKHYRRGKSGRRS